ncbi:mitogen-activated protein kinase kinase kinase [Sarracenia purpurea var. burkii]
MAPLILRSNDGALSFFLGCQLTVEDEDDDEPSSPPLNLITSDDDARCMINEFKKLKSRGMPTRLRTFECDDDGFVNYVGDTENLNGEHGSGGDTKVSRAKNFRSICE